MEREYKVGQSVVFVDSFGHEHNALVTIWWGLDCYTSSSGELGCNLVIVSKDEQKDDSYGRQIERHTSVVHKSKQSASAFYWRWADEV